MSEKPILFSGEMVRAILSGKKTQTCRLLKPQPKERFFFFNTEREPKTFAAKNADYHSPYFKGDVLYVRETWGIDESAFEQKYVYRATDPEWQMRQDGFKWHPSIHMPKDAARIFLKVKDVDCLQLPDLVDWQLKAEGIEGDFELVRRVKFQSLWDSCYGEGAYMLHPFVWRIEFERIEKGEAI